MKFGDGLQDTTATLCPKQVTFKVSVWKICTLYWEQLYTLVDMFQNILLSSI